MRGIYGSLSLASMFAITAMSAADMAPIRSVDTAAFDTSRPKKHKTGEAYPHSSKRQRARYARQIDAGKCNLEPVSRRA